jgi:hypothetical protein
MNDAKSNDITKIEQDFWGALTRLKNGVPTHPKLILDVRCGKLRINIKNVALEARRSRTLIGHADCAYPEVRKAILELKNPNEDGIGLAEQNDELRAENANLRQAVKVAVSQLAAMVRRMDKVEAQAQREIAATQRKVNRASTMKTPNEVAGRTLMAKRGVVIPINPSEVE